MKSKRLNAHAGAVAGKKDIAGFLDKMKEAAKGRELDLSLDEDLSIGIIYVRPRRAQGCRPAPPHLPVRPKKRDRARAVRPGPHSPAPARGRPPSWG